MSKSKIQKRRTLGRIGRRIRNSVERIKEYEITEFEKDPSDYFEPWFLSAVTYKEYRNAQKLKSKLMKKYKDNTLEDIIPGKEIKTTKGLCYHIQDNVRTSVRFIDPEKAKEKIVSDFKLLHGIGEKTENRLKCAGYKTIDDLSSHPRFGSESKNILRQVHKRDISKIIDSVCRKLPKSHPNVLYASSFQKKDDFLILDLETMGLFTRPIILFGVAKISDNTISIDQYLLRNVGEEPAGLAATLNHVKKNCAFLTFNGRTFDIPYLIERLAYYGIRGNLNRPNFDLLHFSRRAWRKKIPDCKLNTLEKYMLGIKRSNDVPSALVPEFYETYLRTNNIGPLIPIIEHNKQDLVTLAAIFSKLHEEWEK